MSGNNNTDAEKHHYWQRTIGEAAASGLSIRELCRQRRLRESRFYRRRHRLEERKPGNHLPGPAAAEDYSLLRNLWEHLRPCRGSNMLATSSHGWVAAATGL